MTDDGHPGGTLGSMGRDVAVSPRVDRWAEFVDRHRSLVSMAHVLSGIAFVAGCVAFYVPAWYTTGVTLFLVGSVLMLAGAVADAIRGHRSRS